MASLYNFLPKRRLPRLLYHYTTQEGLIGIVTSKTVWATSAAYLNDATEFSYGTEIVYEILNDLSYELDKEDNELIEKSRHELQPLNSDSIFVFSLTKERDLLSQWRAYTDGGIGFSIGFQSHAISKFTLERACSNKNSY